MIPVADVPQVAVVESISDVKVATTQNESSSIKAAYVSDYNMNVRSGPGTNYGKIGSIAARTVFKITEYDTTHTWGKEQSTGGWVCLTYATIYTDDALVRGFTTENVNMRSGPGTSYSKITTLPKNSSVIVLNSKDGWYLVKWGDYQGYISGEYLDILTGDYESTATTKANLNLRSGPGTSYSILKTIPEATEVIVYDSQGDWTKVESNGTVGWVSTKYLHFS